MSPVKSLKQLLDAADSFIKEPAAPVGLSKEASDEVSEVVNTILASDTMLTSRNSPAVDEFEKIAEATNRQQALSEIEEICKLAEFCDRAEQSGYTDEQIREALSKIAASRMVKTVPALSALGFMSFGEDKNELPVSAKSKETASGNGRKNLTESQGY